MTNSTTERAVERVATALADFYDDSHHVGSYIAPARVAIEAMRESDLRMEELPLPTPWGDVVLVPLDGGPPYLASTRLAANDNSGPLLIGITGKRNVGKSTVANLLEAKYGFARAHAFDGGKEAAFAYFRHITGSAERAKRMVWGDLKDRPCAELPGIVAPRFFLEKFGHFMGDGMGVEWTLAMEIARVRRESPRAPIVVESLVYEAPWFKAQGGFVLRLERPEFDGPAGVESDSVQAGIEADETIVAGSVDELERKARWVVDRLLERRLAA